MQIEEKGDEEETDAKRKRKASAPRPETGLEAPMGNVSFESPKKPRRCAPRNPFGGDNCMLLVAVCVVHP